MYIIDDIKNKIICGDALEKLKLISDNSIDLVIADPPYNIGKSFIGDSMDHIEYYSWYKKWVVQAYRVLKENGSLFVFLSQWHWSMTESIIKECNFHIINRIIWHYEGGRPAINHYTYYYDPVFFCTKSYNYTYNKYCEEITKKSTTGKIKNIGDVWIIPRVANNNVEREKHPTQKPMRIISRIISGHSLENDVVLDPFFGSGTTGEVCKKLNRNFIGIEISDIFCNMARCRIDKAV